MKKFILGLLIISAAASSASAQCDKKTVWTSMKQEWLNGKGEVQHSDQDKVVLEVSKSAVALNHNDDPNDAMSGPVKEFDCNWNEPYKNGKTVIKSDLSEGQGDVHDAVITIEGNDGKFVITLQLNDKPDMMIRMYADHYEEK